MLIHPWDAALDTTEWQDWLASTDRFGILAVNNLDPAQAPLVLPLHFTLAGDELLIHLARPNPVWDHLKAATEVRLDIMQPARIARSQPARTDSGCNGFQAVSKIHSPWWSWCSESE